MITAALCSLIAIQAPIKIQEHRVEAAGHTWTYHVAARTSSKPRPLVFVFHGAGGNGRLYLERNGWMELASREDVIVCAPTGLPALPNQTANFNQNPHLWNSGQLNPRSPRARIDDLAFFDALLADVKRRHSVKADQIFVTGHSNGAGMTFLLGARRSNALSAIAPVMGQCAVSNPKPSKPLPTLYILGEKDPLNRMEGGTQKLPWGDRQVPPVSVSIEAWAQALSCPLKPASVDEGTDLVTKVYGPGKDDVEFKVVIVKGQGHGWPGGKESGLRRETTGPTVHTYDATREIWKYFQNHFKQ